MEIGKKFNLAPATLHELQRELYEWQKYNFGNQDNELVLMGIFEEAGELCHAQLKLEQGIRGSRESHESAMRDAIGDISIYMLNYLSGIGKVLPGFSARSDVNSTENQVQIRKSVMSIYRLAGKIDCSDPNSESRVKHLISGLLYLCALKAWDLEKIIRETWSEIGKRDWHLYPETGFPK